ncbi:MAG: hypothetical protein V1775_06900 [Bacteroidota bacterium]
MRILTKIILFFFLVLNHHALLGQFYNIGQDPGRIKWEKMETGNFSIIYPDYYQHKASSLALQFNQANRAVSSGLNVRPRHTPLIIHPLNTVSNAYAIWAPRRIEILTTPPQDIYAQPWIQQLALHEYRHVVQLSMLDQGFTRFLGYLLGQQAAAVSTGLFVPSWFIEGDAVATETALSHSGRGRVPSFSQTLRAQLDEKGIYSYPKASLGSFRDFVPDIYTIGYHIVATSRQKYGPQLWLEAMNSVARHPWTFTPFNRGLKKTSGLNKKGLYYETINTLDSLWKEDETAKTLQIPLARVPGCYTNYICAHRVDDSTIIALKKSFSDIPQIVSIDTSGNERKIHTPGYIIDERISYSGGILTWAEYRPHVRWENVGYTTIVQLNPIHGKVNRLKLKRKLYAPVVNPQKNEIAAIEYKPEGDCYITIISPTTTTEYKLPDEIHGSTPCWSPDGEAIVFIATGNYGKALAQINTASGIQKYLSGFSFNEISNPFYSGQNLCFTGTVKGKSQILMAGEEAGSFYALTDVPFGADYASARGEELLFSDYTADGYRIVSQLPDMKSAHQILSVPAKEWPLADALSAQETLIDFNGRTGSEDFEISRYRKAAHLFSVHSWAPVFVDIGGETVRPGVSVMSQNLLSTMFVSAGYDYNLQEEAGMVRADLTWKGWFPVLKATVSEGLRASSRQIKEGEPRRRYTWNETNLNLSISQNLNFSHGQYNTGISGEAGYNYTKFRHNNSTPSGFIEGDLSGLTYRAAAFSYRHLAYRDLGPRKGYYIDAEYRHTPFGQIRAGSIFGIQMQLFIPGLLANHSILLSVGLQKSDSGSYPFSNIISTSRGYTSEFSGEELIAMKASYRLPLLYPDLHAGGLLYVKRIRANFFYDATAASTPEPRKFFNSTGLDLVADFHLLGLSTPISAGIRTVYLESNREWTSGLLFSVNFYDY